MTDEAIPRLQLRRVVKAPREAVFDAWTHADSLAQWLAPRTLTVASAQVDLRVGGRFLVVMRADSGEISHSGVYREIRPPERLAFTWISPATQHRETLVTLDFHVHPEGTEIVLAHSGLPTKDASERHRAGWTSILEKLAVRFP